MKKLVFVFILVLSGFTASALSREDFSFGLSPFLGFKYGQIDEYVFMKECEYPDDKLSELNWEIKPELFAGIKVDGGLKNIFAEAEISAGLPKRTGLMYDSDWKNVKIPGTEGKQYKTNYSESDNYLEYDIDVGFKAGYSFDVLDWLCFKPAVGFEYESIKFTGKNGNYWYGEEGAYGYPYSDAHSSTGNWNGEDVIEYQRFIYIAWLGTDARVKVNEGFEINTGFFFAPYVYALSFDRHFKTPYDYADLTQGFFAAYKWNLGGVFNLTKKSSISLSADCFYMPVLRGQSYGKEHEDVEYYNNSLCEGGAGALYCNITLSYRHKFL